jgi:uncharacterized protein (DUF433 family)
MDRPERITRDPAIMSGKPCIRGTRVTVENVLRLLAGGHDMARILKAYPYLEMEDIKACLNFAAAGGKEGAAPVPVA